jgi:hypothetical protein
VTTGARPAAVQVTREERLVIVIVVVIVGSGFGGGVTTAMNQNMILTWEEWHSAPN